MYSFESSISPSSIEYRQKKRKWEWETKKDAEVLDLQLSKGSKLTKETIEEAKVDVELQLETPLPAEWEQCLDLQVSDRFCLSKSFSIHEFFMIKEEVINGGTK